MKQEDALIWGGLALAGVVAAALYRERRAAAASSAAALTLSPYGATGAARAPIMTAPGYVPPVVGQVAPPATIVGPNAAPAVQPPAPAVGPSAAEANQAFDQSMAEGRQWQRDTFATGSADLLARVQAGEIAPDSAQYRESFNYLANLTGGVATAGAEAAKLTAAGLPPPA